MSFALPLTDDEVFNNIPSAMDIQVETIDTLEVPEQGNREKVFQWLSTPFTNVKLKMQAKLEALLNNQGPDGDTCHDIDRLLSPYNVDAPTAGQEDQEEYFKQRNDFIQDFDRLYSAFVLDHGDSRHTMGSIIYLAKLYKVWDAENNRLKIMDYLELVELYRNYNKAIKEKGIMMKSLDLENMQTNRGAPHTYGKEFIRMSRLIFLGYIALTSYVMYEMDRSINSEQKWTLSNVDEICNFANIDKASLNKPKKEKPFRIIFNMCLNKIKQLKLIRSGDSFLREKQIEDPRGNLCGTSYYEKYCDIKTILSDLQSEGVNKAQFDVYWGNPGIKSAVENALQFSRDSNLIDYKVMHGIVSFRSHLYCASRDEWWNHWDPRKPTNYMAVTYIDDELDTRPITNSIMDLALTESGELQPIVALFRTQGYSDLEIETAAAILGRLLHPFREDGREIFPYLKGVAGAGKGSLLELLQSFYHPDLVGIMSNKMEEIFGLQSFLNKCLLVANDLTEKATFDFGMLLNLISGDKINLPQKHLIARHIVLTAHFIAAGNRVPLTWIDTSGNLKRRIFVLDFKNFPSPPDNEFKKKLLRSGGMAYRFFNCAYLKLFHLMPSKMDLWKNIPERFAKNRDEFLAETSCMLMWISELEEAKRIRFDPQVYWQYEDFEKRFIKWCKEKQKTNSNWMDQLGPKKVAMILHPRNCTIQSGVRRHWPVFLNKGETSRDLSGQYIMGFSFTKSSFENGEELIELFPEPVSQAQAQPSKPGRKRKEPAALHLTPFHPYDVSCDECGREMVDGDMYKKCTECFLDDSSVDLCGHCSEKTQLEKVRSEHLSSHHMQDCVYELEEGVKSRKQKH